LITSYSNSISLVIDVALSALCLLPLRVVLQVRLLNRLTEVINFWKDSDAL
jgi:hypothetical protein